MGSKDPRVDAYIAKSADFAKPILTHIRKLVHSACPDAEETMKWSVPHFDYKGMMCGMAAFKEHCAFNLWKASLVLDVTDEKEAMGQFGRLTSARDLPSDRTMIGYIRKAARLNEEGVKVSRKSTPKAPLKVPTYFQAALKKNAPAHKAFAAFSPSQQREYVEWLDEAKADATREKRLQTAIAWIAEGKVRNWKYMPK
jgi:uncharacterized protein YdeI (YjbR/CyaY-like superfamily)